MMRIRPLLILFLGGALYSQTVTPESRAVASGWRKVSLPATVIDTNHPTENVFVAHDGYAYASSKEGTFRALTSDIESNPTHPAWVQLNGVPGKPGAHWIARAWTENKDGDIITGFREDPSSLVRPCPCAYARLPRGSTTWTIAKGSDPPGFPIMFASDSSGNLYSATLFGQQFLISTNGGKSWGHSAGKYASNPYGLLGLKPGGYFAVAVINSILYAGGEGPILQCDLRMTNCTAVAGGENYHRNVVGFMSDGSPDKAPTEIIEVARSYSGPGPDFGYNVLRWDSTSGHWNLQNSNGLPKYVDLKFSYGYAKASEHMNIISC